MAIEMIGKTFNSLTIIGKAATPASRNESYWNCRCECGKETIGAGTAIRSGHKKSCGCLLTKKGNENRIKHGYAKTSEYQTWRNMRSRCKNPKTINYKYYGARGIEVCKRWMDSFENFLADMGNKPSAAHSIERRDNDGNYEPDNCDWILMAEQATNKRKHGSALLGGLK